MQQVLVVNDWLQHPELLPPRPPTCVEQKYTQLFAVDLQGQCCHDQYVFLAPNGLAVVGLAPSHPLVAAHRRATGYRPLQLQYIPPNLGHLPAKDLAVCLCEDSDAEEGAAGGGAGTQAAAAAAVGPATLPTAAQAASGGDNAGGGGGGCSGPCADQDISDPMHVDAAGASTPTCTAGQHAHAGFEAMPQPPVHSSAAAAAGTGPSGRQPTAFPLEQLARVNFDIGGKDRSQSKLSGKRKNQGSYLQPNSVLARVEARDGSCSFPVVAVSPGQLLEVNQQLLAKPQLLLQSPCREGYVAILYPTAAQVQKLKSELLPLVEYLRRRNLTAEDLL